MIGLDIGSKFIKICQVDKKDNKYTIVSAVMSARPQVADGSDEKELTNKIKGILAESFFSTAMTATAVGDSRIIARNFTFPALAGEELKGALRLEAEQSIFSDLNTMSTDLQVLAPVGKDKIDVLFVAVPKDIVGRRLKAIREAGLNLTIMDIDNLALANCFLAFEPDPEDESIVLLNVGESYTNIAIVDNGELRFVRNVDFGGKDISAEIANYFGVSPKIAEEIKKQPALWSEIGLNIKNILRKSTPDLLEAVYRSIEYCMSRKRLLSIDKILLTGGTSCLQGIDSFIAEVLGITTNKWNPLIHSGVPLKTKQELGQFLSIALGLALRQEKNV